MPDYYVNPTTGNDGNPGTSTSPVRTITRATELAAEVDRATGTIFLDPGTYSALEVFPIEVPPLFGLEGRGRTPNDCRIEFTGGVSDSVAIQAGVSVRNLTVVAAPPPGTPLACSRSIGISIRVDGCELENVGIKLNESEPDDGLTFGTGIRIEGADITASQVHVERTDLVASDSDSLITNCSAINGIINAVSEGATRIENCSLLNSRIGASYTTNAVIEGNTLTGGGMGAGGAGAGFSTEVRPTFRNNIVRNAIYEGLSFSGPGNALVEMNTISAKRRTVSILNGASPFMRNNTFELLNLDGDYRFTEEHLLWVTGARGSPGPGFEGNIFILGHGVFPLKPMWIESAADFGGGIRSLGMNYFRLPTGFFINFDHPGLIYARDNFWNYLPTQYWTGPDTTVDTEGARLDPERIRR